MKCAPIIDYDVLIGVFMKVWLDKNSTFSVDGKIVSFGNTFDESKVNAATLKKLSDMGSVGDKVATSKDLKKVADKSAVENAVLLANDKFGADLKAVEKKHGEAITSLKADLAEEHGKVVKKLEKEIADLKKAAK